MVEELYGLALQDFTAVRNDRAKQARAAGDRELATQIHALRKPTVAAWSLNQLVRAARGEIDALLQLGGELREVMADLGADELRELTRQRHQLVFALVQEARSLGLTRGQPLSEEAASAVRETLEATLSDSVSAEEVAAGRLSDALRVSGFGGSGVVAPPAKRSTRARSHAAGTGGTVTDIDAKRQQRDAREQRELAERAVDTAAEAVERAQAVAKLTESRLKTAREQQKTASEAVEQLRATLDEALTELQDEDRTLEVIAQEKQAAEAKLQVAKFGLTEARSLLQSMST